MKKQFLVALVLLSIAPFGAVAQEIKPVFQVLLTDADKPLPILISKGRTYDANGNEIGRWQDGTRTMDNYMGLHRYDDQRLLLGVHHNGINESDPNHDAALAAAYPDGSLIWIDQSNGHPMGLALLIGIKPIEPSDAWKTAYGDDVPFYTSFDVSDDGVVYVAFADYVLRYAPDGKGGFKGPTVAYQLPDGGNGEHWGISTFSVTGSGPNTRILGGQIGTGYILETKDGEKFDLAGTFTRAGWPPIGGGISSIVPHASTGEEFIYTCGFGNNSRGDDSTFYRLARPINSNEEFANDDTYFSAQGVPGGGDLDYRANFIGDIQGHGELNYVVAYSCPSWNNLGVPFDPERPGFLGLHDVTQSEAGGQDGEVLSSYTVQIVESSEYRNAAVSETPTAEWYATEGTLEVNRPTGAADGACEIIWCSGVYGYGRYVVGDIPVGISDWSLY